jgi:hypothetical protein
MLCKWTARADLCRQGRRITRAIGIAAGSNRYRQAALVIWAICAIPALVLAAVVAARPRVPRVLAGVTLLEAMIVGATYLVFAIAGDRPQRTSGHARQPARVREHILRRLRSGTDRRSPVEVLEGRTRTGISPLDRRSLSQLSYLGVVPEVYLGAALTAR